MARNLRQKLAALIAELEPKLRSAFQEGVAEIRDRVTLRRVVEALERRDIETAIAALNIEDAAFGPLARAIEEAFDSGGSATAVIAGKMLSQTGAQVIVRFDMRNPRAERQIRDYAGSLIREITDDQRAMARQVIEASYAQGRGPNSIALDIVGRISRATGKRTGGFLGLTGYQAEFADNPRWHLDPANQAPGARQQLESGDPELMKAYLTRGRRNKLFDRSVTKAVREGKPLPKDMVDRAVRDYRNSLLQLRGEMIARTETGRAVHAAKHEAFRQGLEKTNYSAQAIKRTWRDAGDSRVRHSHGGMNGQVVRGLDEPFVSPYGNRLMHPLDRSLGAPAYEVVACRCDEDIDIDFAEGLE